MAKKKWTKKYKKKFKRSWKNAKKRVTKRWKKIKRLRNGKNFYKAVLSVLGKLPKNENIIVFESFFGKQYSCNPRAIYEQMQQDYPKLRFYWSIDHRYKELFDERGLKTIKRFSFRWFIVLMRARYWVFNSRLPKWIPKPDKTVYIQTWHGTPLKKLAKDMNEVTMPGTTTEKYKRNFLFEAGRWDYLVAPNPYSAQIFRRAFEFRHNLLETGYPRNDYLHHYSHSDVEQIRENLGIPEGKKVILYAPTWRDNEYYFIGKYKFTLSMDLEEMRRRLGDEYVLLLRLHYLVSDHLDVTGYEDFAIDASAYEDIRDLYVVSDVLITDYSSVMFDYGILKRPMIFYTYDIDSYRDKLRGFYFDFEQEAPGPLVMDTEEIIEEVENSGTIRERYHKEVADFEEQFNQWEDGYAAKRVVEKVFNAN